MLIRLAAAVLMMALTLAPAVSDEKGKGKKKEAPTLGDKVLGFAQSRIGEQVGDGECASLANHALKAAGAHGRYADSPGKGDYVWGNLVFTLEAGSKPVGKLADVKPGAVIQFRDARWVMRIGNRTITSSAPHHTAIVTAVNKDTGAIQFLHQNHSGKRFVQEGVLPLAGIKEGWIRIYEPVPASR